MIEVVARLDGGPAYFAGGEKIICNVTFRNVVENEAAPSSSSNIRCLNSSSIQFSFYPTNH